MMETKIYENKQVEGDGAFELFVSTRPADGKWEVKDKYGRYGSYYVSAGEVWTYDENYTSDCQYENKLTGEEASSATAPAAIRAMAEADRKERENRMANATARILF